MREFNYPEKNVRVPIIPLDFMQKHFAKDKEILIDYQNNDIIIAKTEDGYDTLQFYSLTEAVRAYVQSNLNASEIYITTGTLENVNLATYLNELENERIQLDILDDSQPVVNPIIDNSSLEIIDGKMQLVRFDDANNMSIPCKENGILTWINLDEYIEQKIQEKLEEIRNS